MKRRSLFITAVMAMCLVFISGHALAIQLTGTIRDFTPATNSDFEAAIGVYRQGSFNLPWAQMENRCMRMVLQR